MCLTRFLSCVFLLSSLSFFLYFFSLLFLFFFFNDTATTEIYTLSLHDALPISVLPAEISAWLTKCDVGILPIRRDRKSTRLNSSHRCISYAVFCLKKKKNNTKTNNNKDNTQT